MPEGVWRVTGITDAAGVKAHNPRQRVQRHRRSGGWWRTLAGTRCDARAAVAHERGAGETAHGGAGAGVALVRNALAEAAVERAAELAEASALVPGVVRAAPLAARRMSATGSGQCTGPCAAGIVQGSRAAGGPHRKRPRRRAVSRTRRHCERRCRTAAMRGTGAAGRSVSAAGLPSTLPRPAAPGLSHRPASAPGLPPDIEARSRDALRRGAGLFPIAIANSTAGTSQFTRTVHAFAGVSWHLAVVVGGGVDERRGRPESATGKRRTSRLRPGPLKGSEPCSKCREGCLRPGPTGCRA